MQKLRAGSLRICFNFVKLIFCIIAIALGQSAIAGRKIVRNAKGKEIGRFGRTDSCVVYFARGAVTPAIWPELAFGRAAERSPPPLIQPAPTKKLITKPAKVWRILNEQQNPLIAVQRRGYLENQYRQLRPIAVSQLPFEDLRTRDEITFAFVADTGWENQRLKGEPNYQRKVAKAMAHVLGAEGGRFRRNIDFVLMGGDNFYEPPADGGIRVPTRYRPKTFRQNFEEIYPPEVGSNLRFFAWPGNHDSDFFRWQDGVQAQIDYSRRNPQFFMPNSHWGVPYLPDFIRIGGINSNFIDKPRLSTPAAHAEQVSDMIDYFNSPTYGVEPRRAAFNFLVSHHAPVSSVELRRAEDVSGQHRSTIAGLTPLIEEGGVQFILSGHAHQMAHIETEQYQVFGMGSGGAMLDSRENQNVPWRRFGETVAGSTFNFHEQAYGFSLFRVTREGTMTVEYWGFYEGEKAKDVRLLYSRTMQRK